VLESIKPSSSKQLRLKEVRVSESVRAVQMTEEFKDTYGNDAFKLLLCLDKFFESEGEIVLADLELVIDLIKDFLNKMALKNKYKAIKVVVAANPQGLDNVLDVSGLLNLVKDWIDKTPMGLVDTFIKKELLKQQFSEEEKVQLSLEELEECRIMFAH